MGRALEVLPDGFGSFEADNVQLGAGRIFLSADRDDLSVEGLDPSITLRRSPRSTMAEYLALRQASPEHASGQREGS